MNKKAPLQSGAFFILKVSTYMGFVFICLTFLQYDVN